MNPIVTVVAVTIAIASTVLMVVAVGLALFLGWLMASCEPDEKE